MKRLATLLLAAAALAASPAAAQTVKSLGYNTTNGFIVYSGTNALTFTNALQFATNARAATRTNLGATLVGDAVFTAANAAAGATALGLGTTNDVTFSNVTTTGTLTVTGNVTMNGVGNTAPSQTASSGASLMTRDLSDARYPIYETINPNNNQTAADTAQFYGSAITIPLNWVPSSIQIHAELEFTSSPLAAGATNFRFRIGIRDVEGASMNQSLNTSIVNATSVTNVSGNRYIIKGEITTFPASWSTRLTSHETIFLVLDGGVYNQTGGSLTLVNNQDRRVGYRIFR